MDWVELLSYKRLNRPDALPEKGRTPFQQDIDRIVFSASFRRLAHKTQVHPLSQNDHVHTRLTHSVEVSSVGRSLGTCVAAEFLKSDSTAIINPSSIGDIVAAACLAHDIGNPPFGHEGEESIQSWFLKSAREFELNDAEHADLCSFDGNAQGFRVLTNLENNRGNGGLQLTVATLGAFCKYPRGDGHKNVEDNYPGGKKIGIFQSELHYFENIAAQLGLLRRGTDLRYWSRHPLAFLVEAADDICYSIIDIEDGYGLGYISLSDAIELLEPIAEAEYPNLDPDEALTKLRAVAIGNLVQECVRVFIAHRQVLEQGVFAHELLDLTKYNTQLQNIKIFAREHIYSTRGRAKLQLAGNEILSGLLDTFSEIIKDLERKSFDEDKLSTRTQRLARCLRPGKFSRTRTSYEALLALMDSISAMTDRYALDLYRQLRGISF